MIFANALNSLKRGHKIKRHHWTGYWLLNIKDSKPFVEMHCYDGKVINLLDTNDILYTLENIAADDWEIINDWNTTETQNN